MPAVPVAEMKWRIPRARHRAYAVLAATALFPACGEPVPDALPRDVIAAAEAGTASDTAATSSRAAAPRIRVGESLGSDEARLVVVEFSDPGCVSCTNFSQQSFPGLKEEFIDTGLVQWRTVLIDRGFPNGAAAARSASCAADQDRFWDMRRELARQQRDWIARWSPNERFVAYARQLGLDVAAFTECVEAPSAQGMSVEEMVAFNLNVRAVPTFMVGSQRVLGALGTDDFRSVILRQLELTGGG